MAFYDTQSQLINMARTTDRKINLLQMQNEREEKLAKGIMDSLAKSMNTIASQAVSANEDIKKAQKDKELLASVVPTLGATEAQKQALLKASNLDEASKIATLQQSGVETKSLGYGNGLGLNKWSGEITPYINNTRGGGSGTSNESFMTGTKTMLENLASLPPDVKAEFEAKGLFKRNKEDIPVFSPNFNDEYSKWNNKRLNR